MSADPNNRTILSASPISQRTAMTVGAFKQALVDNLYYTRGQGAPTATIGDIYFALAHSVRDHLMERWHRSVAEWVRARPKFVYYLSAEYLPGKQITQNLLYTDTDTLACEALEGFGYNIDELIEVEPEPALGNGGLGRLAACYMDSLATLQIPSVAYGIHYEYGIFKQSFRDGWQVESPEDWQHSGYPWEFEHPDQMVEVGFGGRTEKYRDEAGRSRTRWIPAETVLGAPSHVLVPGYGVGAVNMLRLWRARASQDFNFQLFDVGDYSRAAEQKISSENLTKVLYPNDNTPQGRELRLKQEYFFAACSLRDILRRFETFHTGWESFPEKVVIQLNDTHPVVAIPELMRLLMDERGLDWALAWKLTSQSFAYTCHTLLPEALEKWPVVLFERLLPRHLEIIYDINQQFLEEVGRRFPNQPDRVARLSVIEEGSQRQVRMAHLAAAACFSINGVAELHTDLLRRLTLHDFYEMWPEKFNNKTNGVSPRRFVRLANPRLATLIDRRIGSGWTSRLDELEQLVPYAGDPAFREDWRQVKLENKQILARVIAERIGAQVDPQAMFDVMVKRLHEYKRQLLKAMHILTLYYRLKDSPGMSMQPRVFIFGAKAAPGYHAAKLVIKLINSVAAVINADPQVNRTLEVAFLPNFNVTLGEKIYPAADLSEQISLAGKEASGTGNMKFALNGAVTIGTLDGANIEIRQRVGPENFFLFGLTAEQVLDQKQRGYQPAEYYRANPELKRVIDQIASGAFSGGDAGLFRPIVDHLLLWDEYMLMADYAAYIQAQDQVDLAYADQERWTRMSILNSARCGYFSSDRAVQQYCDDIWKVKPVPVALNGGGA